MFQIDVPNTGNKANKETTKQEEKSRKKKTEHEKTNNSHATDLNLGIGKQMRDNSMKP